MKDDFKTDNPELEALFERYRVAPGSHVFAPLADACRKAGMLEEAIEICEKGVSTHPRYASGLVVRGKCYYDLGSSDQAEASFEKVLQLDVNNLVALKYMGLILAARGEAEAAREHFEHILALDPGDREIAGKLEELTLGEARAILDDESSMRGLIDDDEIARPRTPADAADEPEDGFADDGFTGGEIRIGAAEPTTDVLATMTLAEIYASQGYRGKALKIFRELLTADPENEAVKARLSELGDTREGGAPHGDHFEAANDVPDTEDAPEYAVEPSVEPDDPAEEAAPPAGRALSRKGPPRRPARKSTSPGDTGATQFKRWLDNLHQ